MIAYLITNSVNGRKYVGVTTVSLKRRWACHRCEATHSSQKALHRAIRKYGHESFTIEVVACARSADDLCAMERVLIEQYGAKAPHGYNMTDGGDGTAGRGHTAEAKEKIGKFWRGRVRSEATRRLISIARKGILLTVEHRAKLAAAKIGKKLPPRSEQHCKRISDGVARAHARRANG